MGFRPVFVLLVARTVGLAATFFIPVVLARLFDQTEFGTYKQLFLVYATLYTIAQVGMAESLFYFLPRLPARGGALTLNAVLVLLLAGAASLAGLWSAAVPVARWMGNTTLAPELPLLGLFAMLMTSSAALEITMLGQKHYGRAALTYMLSDLTRGALLVLPVLVLPSMRTLLLGAVAFAAGRLVFTVLYLRTSYADGFRPSGPLVREQLAYAVPFALAVVVETVQAQLHQFVVSYAFDAATFAVYSVACLQIPLIGYAATAASDVLMVRMGESLRDGNRGPALAAWHDTVRKLALLFFPILATLLVVGDELIVILYTDAYAAAAPLFKLACLSILAGVVPVDSVLRVYAATRFLFVLNLLRVAIVVLAIGPLIQMLHLSGAIVVTLGATGVTKAVALWRIRKLMDVGWAQLLPWRSLGAGGAAAAAAAAASLAVRHSLPLPSVPLLVTSSAVCGAAYVGLAAALGVVRRSELATMTRWLRAPGGGER